MLLGRNISEILEEERRLLDPVPPNVREAGNARKYAREQPAVPSRGGISSSSWRKGVGLVGGTMILCFVFLRMLLSTTLPTPTTPMKDSVGGAAASSAKLHDLHLGALFGTCVRYVCSESDTVDSIGGIIVVE